MTVLDRGLVMQLSHFNMDVAVIFRAGCACHVAMNACAAFVIGLYRFHPITLFLLCSPAVCHSLYRSAIVMKGTRTHRSRA